MINKGPLEFLAHKKLIESGKTCLEILEELELDYNDSQNKLLDTLKSFPIDQNFKDLLIQIIILNSIFTENKKLSLRKRILDKVNNSSRDLSEEFEKYNITM